MAHDPENPLLVESDLPFAFPPFDRIEPHHFRPAFERGMEAQRREVEAIAAEPAPPTVENVCVALERSGRLLQRVRLAFSNLVGAHTNDALEAIRTEMAPKLSGHSDAILLDPRLFERIDAVHARLDELELDAESRRLVERYHLMFVRAGARLSDADKERLRAMNAELAELATRFSQNVLEEVNASAVVVDSRDELAGLSEGEITAAADAARERDLDGKYVLPLQNTSGQPVLASLEHRPLRRRILEASLARGSRGGEFDNREIVSRVLELRAERARLLGYENHAAYVLEDQTARSTDAVNERLSQLVPPAVRNARREAERLQRMIDEEGDGIELEAWDWPYYAEKVRRAEYDLEQSALRPYLELNRVLEHGVFHAAEELFGLSFSERFDLPTYHPDVRVFDVVDEAGTPVALFLADLYARPSKRGGAWMNAYVRQSGLHGDRPVVGNHQNIRKPPEGEPTLLTLEEVNTMFHEFGHALHGILSDVRYPFFSGTSVPRDFVEFPSQLNEVWGLWPEVLSRYAVHHETGEPLPAELAEKVRAMRRFNQGYATTEYLAACVLDQALHQLAPDEVPAADELMAFEAEVLRNAGIALRVVPPRYRVTYFSHILGGYSAGYYSYIWAEVLDADAVAWFEEHGGLRRENGEHLRRTVLVAGR
ncbi:MAG: M3 family metallopeptidase [Gemmatimonadota bacterium]|nr:M3 family metallopeptidase [Gemmatimonadota bacterium]